MFSVLLFLNLNFHYTRCQPQKQAVAAGKRFSLQKSLFCRIIILLFTHLKEGHREVLMDEEKRSNQNYEIIESCTIGSTAVSYTHLYPSNGACSRNPSNGR